MNVAIAILTLFLIGAGACLFLLIRKFGAAHGSLPMTAEWITELSVERYKPMLRLLDSRDIEYLRHQPGFNPGMVTQFRQQRYEIFQGYLRCLQTDFGRVCTAIKMLLCQSSVDRPDLASALLHRQVKFACGMLSVEVHVFLYRWGLGSVDVSELVKLFDVTRLDLRSLVPAEMGAAA